MGTWGHRSFENDGALDWVSELQSTGVEAIRDALHTIRAADASTYIDADDAVFTVAAAEVVAAARGHAAERLPEAVVAWLAANGSAISDDDVVLANEAVRRVRDSSELQELWADHGPENDWTREIANLLGRLAASSA